MILFDVDLLQASQLFKSVVGNLKLSSSSMEVFKKNEIDIIKFQKIQIKILDADNDEFYKCKISIQNLLYFGRHKKDKHGKF
jgi:hypothetical protein